MSTSTQPGLSLAEAIVRRRVEAAAAEARKAADAAAARATTTTTVSTPVPSTSPSLAEVMRLNREAAAARATTTTTVPPTVPSTSESLADVMRRNREAAAATVPVTPAPPPVAVTIGSTIVFMVHHEQPFDAEFEHDHRIVYSPRHASAELARVHGKCDAWPKQIFVEGTVRGFWTVSADGSTSRSADLTDTELAEWESAGYDDAGYVVYVGLGSNSDFSKHFVRPGNAFQHLKPATVSDEEVELSAPALLGSISPAGAEGITLSVPKRWVSPRRSVPSNPRTGQLAAAGQRQIFGWLAPGEPLGWSAVETGGTYAASYPGRTFAYAPLVGAESLLGQFVVFRGTVCVVESVPDTTRVVLVMAGRADEPLSRRVWALHSATRDARVLDGGRSLEVFASEVMPLHSSSGTWDPRRPIFAKGDRVLVAQSRDNKQPETVASWEYTYTLARNSTTRALMDKYRAYYEKESRKEYPNYTLMDMMLFAAACTIGGTATSVVYAMESAPSAYVAASAVSAGVRVGDWVAFQVDSMYSGGDDLTRLVYSPRRFAAHTDYALPQSYSVRVHGLVTGTWSSPATRGGYLVGLVPSGTPDSMNMLKSVFGRADGSRFEVRVPFERILETGVAARQSISSIGHPTPLEGFAAFPPLALTSAAVARTALKANDFVCYRGAFCVVCDEGQPPKQSDTAAVWDAAEVELLTLVPESSSPSVSNERRTARYCDVIPVRAECADVPEYGHGLPPAPVGTRTLNGRITASRVTFTIGGKPPSQHAVFGYTWPFAFSDIAAAAADERAKTGRETVAPRYYGQLDSTLASIPTRDAKIACRVEYTTTMYLGDSEPMEVGRCVIHAGWLWVVTQVVPTTAGRVTYDLAEVEPSHLAGASARTPRRVAASNIVPTAWRLSATALPPLAPAASKERYLLACGGASTYDASYTGQVPMNSHATRVAADRALLDLTRQNPTHFVTRAYVTTPSEAAGFQPGCIVVYKGRAWVVVAPAQGTTRTIEQVFPYVPYVVSDGVQARQEVPLADLVLPYITAGPLVPPKFAIGSEVAWAPRIGAVCELATVTAVSVTAAVPYAWGAAPDTADAKLLTYQQLLARELRTANPNYKALNEVLRAVAVRGPLVPTYTYTLRADPIQGSPAIQDMTETATASTYDQARGFVPESNIAARPKLCIGARVSLAGLDFHNKIVSTALSRPGESTSDGTFTDRLISKLETYATTPMPTASATTLMPTDDHDGNPPILGEFMEPDYAQSVDRALAILQDLANGSDHPVYGREARAAASAAKKIGQLGVAIKYAHEVSGEWISRRQRLREATLDLAYRAREPVQCVVTAIFLRGGGRRHCTPAANASYATGVEFRSFLPPYISYTGQDAESPWPEPPSARYVAPESGTKLTYLIQWRPRDTAVGQQTYMLNENALIRQGGSLTYDDLNSRCNRALNDPSHQQWRWKNHSFRPAEVMAVDPGDDFYYEKEQYYKLDGTRPMRTRINPLIDAQSSPQTPPELRPAVEAQTLLVANDANLTFGAFGRYNPANPHSMISVIRYMNRLTSTLGPWDDPANRLTMECPTGAVLIDEGSDRWNDPTSTVGTADTALATQYTQTPLKDIAGAIGSEVNIGGARRVLNYGGAWPYGCLKNRVGERELTDQASRNVHLDHRSDESPLARGVVSREAALFVW